MIDEAEDMAQTIAVMLCSDSMIPTAESRPRLLEAIRIDGVPSQEEAEVLCYGALLDEHDGDEWHSIDSVGRRFPHIDEVIKGFF